jgi:hypothetical protein
LTLPSTGGQIELACSIHVSARGYIICRVLALMTEHTYSHPRWARILRSWLLLIPLVPSAEKSLLCNRDVFVRASQIIAARKIVQHPTLEVNRKEDALTLFLLPDNSQMEVSIAYSNHRRQPIKTPAKSGLSITSSSFYIQLYEIIIIT